MRKVFAPAFFLILFFHTTIIQAQVPARYKIAVFAPLYLDSVFDETSSYRYSKTFPKFLNSGLEFYQGAQLALDSLQKMGAPLEVFFYDSKSKTTPIAQQVNSPELQDVSLIIGHANAGEVRTLADAAQTKKVPFISATLPNDAGVVNNPYFVILNSTLKAHCEGIYKYLQKYHSLDHIILFTKNGVQEDQVKRYFNDITQSVIAPRLKINIVTISNSFTIADLTNKLDSTHKTVCIAGSLDADFGRNLAEGLAAVSKNYPLSIVGMPTWEDISFSKSGFRDVEIMYTAPFYYTKYNKLISQITSAFTSRVNGRPTDMYYRGYEVMLRFALLLLDTKKDMASNLTKKENIVFTPFDIEPVFLNKQNMTLDYFENKNLYFIKVMNGTKNIQY